MCIYKFFLLKSVITKQKRTTAAQERAFRLRLLAFYSDFIGLWENFWLAGFHEFLETRTSFGH